MASSSSGNVGSASGSAAAPLDLTQFRANIQSKVTSLKDTLTSRETDLFTAIEKSIGSEKAMQEAAAKVDQCRTTLNECQSNANQVHDELQNYCTDYAKISQLPFTSSKFRDKVTSIAVATIGVAENEVAKCSQKLSSLTTELNNSERILLTATQEARKDREAITQLHAELERLQTVLSSPPIVAPESLNLADAGSSSGAGNPSRKRPHGRIIIPPTSTKAEATGMDLSGDGTTSSSGKYERGSVKHPTEAIKVPKSDISRMDVLAKVSGSPTLDLTDLTGLAEAALKGAGSSSRSSKRLKPSAPAAPASSLSKPERKAKPPLLSEFYTPGTRVFHQGKEGFVKSYNPDTNMFTVTIAGKDCDLENVPYYPKVGDICLIQEVEENDEYGRYYKAKITNVDTSNGLLVVDHDWPHFDLRVEGRQLESPKDILPLSQQRHKQSRQLKGLRSDDVQSNEIWGTGYYLERKNQRKK